MTTVDPEARTIERRVVIRGSPFNAEAPLTALDEPVTSVADFYVRTNLVVPRVDRDTWTVTIDGLVEHWESARVEATLEPANRILASTKNIDAVTFSLEPGRCPFDPTKEVTVELDDAKLVVPRPQTDRSWSASFQRRGVNRWTEVNSAECCEESPAGALRRQW